MKDIFITGMGIISAIGRGRAATLQSLLHDRSGIATITRLDTSRREYPAGEVQLSNQEMMQRLSIPQATAITRSALMGAIAIEEALQQAQLHEKGTLRIALVNGTTVGGMDMSEKYYLDFMNNNDRNAYISTHDCGACTEAIADHFGIFTHVETISTACSSAANAILKAAELIRNNRADIVVAGGSECLTRFHLNGFSSLMILDQRPCRPFDAQRSGINLGEGAAYLVIEATETISKRPGTKKLCQLAGYANTCDAFHQTASSPTGEGARLSMTAALKNAGLAPADIDYINAHGTGTDNNDLSEGTAIVEVFRDAMPPVSSTKAYTGHATSAAGSIEAVISILALQHSFIPANRNLAIAMPELPFTPPADARPAKLRHILTNSFGFGGNDTTLIFSACNKDNTIPQPGDGTPTIQSTNNDCTVGSQRLHSRQPTTAQSATNDCTVGNQQLHSRQPTTRRLAAKHTTSRRMTTIQSPARQCLKSVPVTTPTQKMQGSCHQRHLPYTSLTQDRFQYRSHCAKNGWTTPYFMTAIWRPL
ncbi:MAG: beta-ketoacyl-[acyl-carrier-protein] synthase family protein [Tannerellaceae bacterium]|jgi:3-oxoacyl-[acyl-carrier-protein] synthase-1|nr:beta-ketoacyl-[acyl-carrier-protein] synthase family protein [Tannerellaceae bacterium]